MTNEVKNAVNLIKEYLALDKDIEGNEYLDSLRIMVQALESSISIPSGATNGDVIKALFPRIKHSFTDKDSKVYILEPNDILTPILTVFDSWWNAPYREGDGE